MKMQEKMGNAWVLVSRNVWPPHTGLIPVRPLALPRDAIDFPSGSCQGRTAAALYGNVCTELVQHAHAVYTSVHCVACGAQRVLSMQ
jgi:hypothetical protein